MQPLSQDKYNGMDSTFKKLALWFAIFVLYSQVNATADIFHKIYVTKQPEVQPDANWLIVGAGPAGIATLGVLLDLGVNPQDVVWIDPIFGGGRLEHYGNVPGNNKPQGFIKFILACKAFQDFPCPEIDYLKNLEPNCYPELSVILNPLVKITEQLCTKVRALKTHLTSLHFNNDVWYVGTSDEQSIRAMHVVLATGSHPKTLDYGANKIVPLDSALDRHKLATIIESTDTVGVVGSSHSAILLLKFLSEMPVKQIYNFYKHPILYAVDMGGWFSNPYNGLRGIAAEWARTVLEVNPPQNLQRIQSSDQTLLTMLPGCDKIIYAIGFERNELPSIDGQKITTYNETNGFIAPRLFGIGIAFPELTLDGYGNEVHRIGLESFMDYAQRMVPQWVNDPAFRQRVQKRAIELKEMSDLFTIHAY